MNIAQQKIWSADKKSIVSKQRSWGKIQAIIIAILQSNSHDLTLDDYEEMAYIERFLEFAF